MNRPKDEHRTITLKHAKNIFDKVQQPFLLKILWKKG